MTTKLYGLMGTPAGETERRLVELREYRIAWVEELREIGNAKAADILDFIPTEPPVALGFSARERLIVVDGTVHQEWDLVPLPVPVITAAQARIGLNSAGLRATVEAAVSAAGGDVADYWEYSTELHREHPIVEQMRAALGLSPEQMDALFWQASAL